MNWNIILFVCFWESIENANLFSRPYSNSFLVPSLLFKNTVVYNNNYCYQVLEEIGVGAYSKVYKVKFMDSRKDYALKALSKAKVIFQRFKNNVPLTTIIHLADQSVKCYICYIYFLPWWTKAGDR